MGLGMTHPLTEIHQEYFLGVKCVELTNLPPSCTNCLEIWEPQAPGNLRACPRPVMGLLYLYRIIKGKAGPLQAWSDAEGSRKLRYPDYITAVQGGGKVVSLTHRPHLPPGNSPGTHFC